LIYKFFEVQLYSILYSFQSNNINEIISNPIEYFKLMEHTNITYIIGKKNITDKNKIIEYNENKENCIKNLFNFTQFNNNIGFELSQKKLKINNIIHGIGLFFKNIELLFVIIFGEKLKFLKTNNIFFLILFFLLNFFTLISEIINILDISKLILNLEKFLNDIKECFRIEISPTVSIEKNKLVDYSVKNFISLIISSAFIAISIYLMKDVVGNRITLRTYNDYFNSRIN